jgi:hypothetical protein
MIAGFGSGRRSRDLSTGAITWRPRNGRSVAKPALDKLVRRTTLCIMLVRRELLSELTANSPAV